MAFALATWHLLLGIDAACCHRCSVVCVCACVSVGHSRELYKTDKPIFFLLLLPITVPIRFRAIFGMD